MDTRQNQADFARTSVVSPWASAGHYSNYEHSDRRRRSDLAEGSRGPSGGLRDQPAQVRPTARVHPGDQPSGQVPGGAHQRKLRLPGRTGGLSKVAYPAGRRKGQHGALYDRVQARRISYGPAETADEIVMSKASPTAAPQHGIRINPGDIEGQG